MNNELELYEEFEETDFTELYSPNIRKQLNNFSHIWKRNLIENNFDEVYNYIEHLMN